MSNTALCVLMVTVMRLKKDDKVLETSLYDYLRVPDTEEWRDTDDPSDAVVILEEDYTLFRIQSHANWSWNDSIKIQPGTCYDWEKDAIGELELFSHMREDLMGMVSTNLKEEDTLGAFFAIMEVEYMQGHSIYWDAAIRLYDPATAPNKVKSALCAPATNCSDNTLSLFDLL